MYFLLIAEKGSVKVSGNDMLVFQWQSVQFECLAEGWYPQPTLQWQVNDKKVSTYIFITIIFTFNIRKHSTRSKLSCNINF